MKVSREFLFHKNISVIEGLVSFFTPSRSLTVFFVFSLIGSKK